MFGLLVLVFSLAGILCVVFGVMALLDTNPLTGSFLIVAAVILVIASVYAQTHRIVPTQFVGITRNTISQELAGPKQAGIISKPFFGSVYNFPASEDYQRCEKFTSAIAGSYGVTLDLCFYIDASSVNWLAEINRTGVLDANQIMSVWRNNQVDSVALAIKTYTPEELSDNRNVVAATIYENVLPWYTARGIPLTRITFNNWDFTSEEVGKAFDESIISQRKITEQTALLQAAKISRQREEYEAETAKLVAEWQKASLNTLGLEGQAAIDYFWIKLFSDKDKVPDVVIIGTNSPVSIPIQKTE